MDLSIIITTYNTKKLTLDSINSIKKFTKSLNYETIVVDNASTDSSITSFKKLETADKNFRLILNKTNRGFAAANNQGAAKARGKYLLFLNSDTLVKNNVLGEMVHWMEKKSKTAITTCALKNKDNSYQATGGYFPTLVRVFSWMTIQDIPFIDKVIKPFHPGKEKSFSKAMNFYKKSRQIDWVTGAFLLIKKSVFKDVGGWNEKYFMYTEDVDLCYRVKKKNWQIWYLPQWSIIHFGGASGSKENTVLSEYKGIKRFYKNNYPSWQYPFLRLFLKIGALGRIVLMGMLEGRNSLSIYVKAFKQA